jgi:hypothetical protein
LQVLKLGIATAISNLSEDYVIWDLDMIALKPVRLYSSDGRTIRHIGGYTNKGYTRSFERLTGLSAAGGHDGSSFVTHWIVGALMYKSLSHLPFNASH